MRNTTKDRSRDLASVAPGMEPTQHLYPPKQPTGWMHKNVRGGGGEKIGILLVESAPRSIPLACGVVLKEEDRNEYLEEVTSFLCIFFKKTVTNYGKLSRLCLTKL